MAARRSPTQDAVADAAARSDVRAAAGARTPAPGDLASAASRHGPGSGDPLVAGLRKSGLLRLLVLHLLAGGPSYGNQLMERVGALTGGLVAVNPNTMYPLLRALEADGLVAGAWEHPERRSRRFYEPDAARRRRARPPGGADRPASQRAGRRSRRAAPRAGRLSAVGTATARQQLPGASAREAQRLWFDLARWPAFVDGFGTLAREAPPGQWPQPGARIVWDSLRNGRGRVVENVVELQDGVTQLVRVEDPTLHGTQRVRFTAYDGGCEIALELDYVLKAPGLGGRLTDLFFVRRSLSDALRRTVRRFAVELEADRAMQAESERPQPRSRNEKES